MQFIISGTVPLKTDGNISLHVSSYLIHRSNGNIPLTVKLLSATMPKSHVMWLAEEVSDLPSFLSCQQFRCCLDWQSCNGTLPNGTSTRSRIQAALIFPFFTVISKLPRAWRSLRLIKKHRFLAYSLNWKWNSTDILSLDQTLSKAIGVLFRKEPITTFALQVRK